MKSFSTAFKSVYEKGLMKYGFKKVKGKRPYYVRCIGNEIVHVISYKDMFTYRQNIPGVFNKAFIVIFGVATIYRRKIAFDALPKDNTRWLSDLSEICFKENYYPAHDRRAYDEMIPIKFEYAGTDEDAMMAEITRSFALTEKYAIPVLDKVTTLEECMKHFFKYNNFILAIPEVTDAYVRGWAAGDHNEGLLSTRIYGKDKIEEYKNSWKKVFEESDENKLYLINAGMCGTTMEEHRRNVIEGKKELKELFNRFDILQNTPEWQEKIRKELEQRKNNNIEILRECGFEV